MSFKKATRKVRIGIKGFFIIMHQVYNYEILRNGFHGIFTVAMDIQRITSIRECRIRFCHIRATSDECNAGEGLR